MKKKYLSISIFVIIFLSAFLWFSHSPSRVYSRVDLLMDTFFEIKISDPQISRSELESVLSGAIAYGKTLEGKLDVFNPASEVNALNVNGKHKCSDELFDILQKSVGISEITGGKFDITTSPVLNAKGFYSRMPEALRSLIPKSFDGVGWENVILSPDSNDAELLNGAWIDPSGIAKGYIVSKISDYLKNIGIRFFLINAGGDIYCTTKSRGQFWKIGVREPGSDKMVLALMIKNMAVATSGDYENVVKSKDGVSFISHIIDPSRNEPIVERAASVTVITPNAAVADALATGMMAMNKEDAVNVANSVSDVEIIAIEHTFDENVSVLSDGAAKYIIEGEI